MTRKAPINGASIMYHSLVKHNVKDSFIYTGGAIMPLIDMFSKNLINSYINTHEQASGHAAIAYARVTGKPGLVITTSGPGLTNMVTPILDAKMDSTPLVVISGQVPIKALNTQAFQEAPAVEITKPITKWSKMITSVDEIEDVVDQAFDIASSGKPGPVHIDVPKCCLLDTRKQRKAIKKNLKFSQTPIYPIVETISKDIILSKKPVIICGKGANQSYREIRELSKRYQIPTTTTIHGMGIMDEVNHDMSLGFLGMHGSVVANYAVHNADLIIGLGNRFDDRTIGTIDSFAPNATIYHINIDEDDFEKTIKIDYKIKTDCKKFVSSLLQYLDNNYFETQKIDWINQINQWKNKYSFDSIFEKYHQNQLNVPLILHKMNPYLYNKNFTITTGVGNHQMFVAQYIKWRKPNQIITSGGLGVMGSGLPYAVGAQIADPKALVIDIDGDGSFNQMMSELITINRYNLNVKIIIFNDSTLSMVKAWEDLFFEQNNVATDLVNPNYQQIAKGNNIHSILCTDVDDIDETLDAFFNYPKSILCEFRVLSTHCYPLVTPGKPLDSIMLPGILDEMIDESSLPPN